MKRIGKQVPKGDKKVPNLKKYRKHKIIQKNDKIEYFFIVQFKQTLPEMLRLIDPIKRNFQFKCLGGKKGGKGEKWITLYP